MKMICRKLFYTCFLLAIPFLLGNASAHAQTGYPQIINAGNTIKCDGSTDDTSAWNTLLSVSGGTIVMPANCTSMVTTISFTANQITLDCEGSTIKQIANTSGDMVTGSSVGEIRIKNCVFDGNSQTATNNLLEFDNSSNIIISDANIQNVGVKGKYNFSQGIKYQQTSGMITNTRFNSISGYCLWINGVTDGVFIADNNLENCYKSGIEVIGPGNGELTITGNVIDYVYDYAGASSGAYGNGILISNVANAATTGNYISHTEYSGIRVATGSTNVSVTGNTMFETGDWCIFAQDYQGGNNNISGNTCNQMLGGGIVAANAGDNLAFGMNITGNNIYNAIGSSTNAGSTTPLYSNGIIADGMVNVSDNMVNGAYFGVKCNNGESGPYAEIGCTIDNNSIMDTRPVTITVTGTSGSVTGSTSGVQSDKLYVTSYGSLNASPIKAVVVSCTPISSGNTCTAPTSITVNMMARYFSSGQAITDNGPTGNMTATVGTVTGTAMYLLTLSNNTNFNLFDDVTVGSGVTQAHGFITCANNVVSSPTGCPTSGTIMVGGLINSSGVMVQFPSSGTITDNTSNATATVSAVSVTPVNMNVGAVGSSSDTAKNCSMLIQNNHITGYSLQAIGGALTGTNIGALGSGVCVQRDPLMGNGPTISGGGITTAASFVNTPTDTSFAINVGQGLLSPITVTYGVPYTNQYPNCSVQDITAGVAPKFAPSLTTLTIPTTCMSPSDIVQVSCTGGN